MCVYACICIWMRMCVYDIAWLVEALLLRFSICAYVYIFMRMYMCVHVCVYMCMCICMYMYICMSVYMYAYKFYIRTRVGVHMHSCRRIFFICTVQSLYYMPVYARYFWTLACVCVGGLEVGFVSACSWFALVTGVGGYVLAGVEIGVLSCIFLYFCECEGGVCVCACIRAYTHTNYLDTWCEPRCREDTWRVRRTLID